MKKLLAITFVLGLLVPSVSFGAIAYDNAVDGGYAAASSLTYPFTTAGSNIGVAIGGITAGGCVGSATYAGAAAALVGLVANGSGCGFCFFVTNAASGTNNVVVSATSSLGIIESGAESWNGVANAAYEASSSAGPATLSAQTATLSTVSDNSWTAMCAAAGTGVISAGAGATLRVAANSYGMLDSGGPVHPAGSYSMTYNSNNGTDSSIMFSFAPYTAAAPTAARRKPVIIQ